ncbi:HSF-type DNA-binding-domain-containing protein [Pisolithus marmoratus]|nr:HSF-type DNA-binding-domain-containing protein [Pisolithus marmoratus]
MDILPSSHPSVHQNTSEPRQFKREQLQQPPPPPPPPPPPAPPQTQKDSDDNMPATSDFVKKLYKMLEDQSFSHVVSWGPNGDCFVVKDMNEFTKSILPRMFKHSNFASFVRQLNKYDFHKVKNTDDSQFGEHSWTFKHPDFHADRRDALENIKRKVPAARKSAPSGSGIGPSTLGRSGATSGLRQQVTALQSQNDSLRTQLGRSEDRVRGLERYYKDVLGEMVHFQRNLAQQDALMQSLVQYFLRSEGDPTTIARASLAQMNEMSRRAGAATDMASTTGTGSVNGSDMTSDIPDGNGSADVDGVDGIGVCGGEGFEKEESPGAEEVVQPTPTNPGVRESSSGTSGTASSSSGGGQKLRVRRSTFVPGWAVPPRVLLVDDDAVSRRLSSKFLQVFGCAIDVAVDGVGAVNKMNLEKYDLVLMDIVMPKMDGISATSLIRRFDHITPIISMTSNSRPAEIMTYYSSGMNDVLPKPFTKEGLLDMLEKHLRHLKVIQEMSRVPRMPCGPRLSTENSLTDALVPASTTSSATPSTTSPSSSATTVTYSGTEGDEIGPPSQSANAEGIDGDGSGPLFMGGVGTDVRIDPLAGMGLTEERYQAILKDLVSGENLNGVGVPEGFGFDMMGDESMGMGVDVNVEEMSGGMSSDMGMGEKRGLEEESDGIREVKRGRFEVLD